MAPVPAGHSFHSLLTFAQCAIYSCCLNSAQLCMYMYLSFHPLAAVIPISLTNGCDVPACHEKGLSRALISFPYVTRPPVHLWTDCSRLHEVPIACCQVVIHH